MARTRSSTTMLALGLLLVTLAGQCYGQLRVGYYNYKCGSVNVESVVFNVVKKYYLQDQDTVADLVRMQFHDCFVRGCDASILLEGANTEKTSGPDSTVAGYEIIEEAKITLDKSCPGVVSCADIIIIAARAAVYLGGANWYNVETGRKDGTISRASEAVASLPAASIPIPQAVQMFGQKGMSTEDFVVLLGCHSVGTAHCKSFQDRLWNFHNTGSSDPSMNTTLLAVLKKTCPRYTTSNNEAFLDQTPGSQFKMDNGFYKAILAGKGILEVDQQLALHPLTSGIVKNLAYNPTLFPAKIGPAMVKLGRVGVLTTGTVRKGTCRY